MASAALQVRSSTGAGSPGRVVAPGAVVVQPWNANTSNTQTVQGHVTLDGKPVSGALVNIDGWTNPTPTDSTGAFTYPADNTLAQRHVARVVDVTHATIAVPSADRRPGQAVAREERRDQRRLQDRPDLDEASRAETSS